MWRFPLTAGENGGGVFILVYLVAKFFLASPLFMAAFAIFPLVFGFGLDPAEGAGLVFCQPSRGIRKQAEAELGFGQKFLFRLWLFVVRFIAPAGVFIILLVNVF